MKRKLLCIILAACLVLSVVMPATALAAKGKAFDDFEATGTIDSISEGTVIPAGNSGRWRVSEREISGVLSGDDVDGVFNMTYKANIESVETQAGNLHGILEVGDYTFKVRGKIQPLQMVNSYFDSTAEEWVPLPFGKEYPEYPGVYWLPRIDVEGSWTHEGTQGNGTFSAWAIFTADPDTGHVVYIPFSEFTMDGKWKQ